LVYEYASIDGQRNRLVAGRVAAKALRLRDAFEKERAAMNRFNGAELSESVLARDWNSPQEDAAWSNL
jgi:hypothetical protein